MGAAPSKRSLLSRSRSSRLCAGASASAYLMSNPLNHRPGRSSPDLAAEVAAQVRLGALVLVEGGVGRGGRRSTVPVSRP